MYAQPFRFVLLNTLEEGGLEVHELGREGLAAFQSSQEPLADLVVRARRTQLCDAVPRTPALDHGSDESFVFCNVPLFACRESRSVADPRNREGS